MNRPDCLYIVIPCYNEEQVLPVTSGMFLDELNHLIKAGKISSDSRIMFVNDGSSDSTWDIITDLSKKDEHFIGISQSRNRGHQSSVLAGLMEASQYADMTISIVVTDRMTFMQWKIWLTLTTMAVISSMV